VTCHLLHMVMPSVIICFMKDLFERKVQQRVVA
jgi:hypothetical protein